MKFYRTKAPFIHLANEKYTIEHNSKSKVLDTKKNNLVTSLNIISL